MDSDNEVENNHSDNEEDSKTLDQFVESVIGLSKKVQLKKASRTEPTLKISEYNLVKSITGDKGKVKEGELTKLLSNIKVDKKTKQVTLSAKRKSKTLLKPVEKPTAERIKQSIIAEKVSGELDRWDAVITSNRASNHLSFPLESNLTLDNSTTSYCDYRLKSDLQNELEALEPQDEVVVENEQEAKFPLTKQEILERRREMAQLRAKQSYIEAKAKRQGRIKSKKFHRIQKKAKTKQQIKDFEKLQETNPEEALKKLEEIDRVRAQERASLRHRSTGKWAKNKQVLAKYDKESRQALAQQLAISRELTQKLQKNDSESEDEEEEDDDQLMDAEISHAKNDENNPWTNSGTAPSGEFSEFVGEYRKFWQDNNSASQNAEENKTLQPEPKKTDIEPIIVQPPSQSSKSSKISQQNGKANKKENKIKEKIVHKNAEITERVRTKKLKNVKVDTTSRQSSKQIKEKIINKNAKITKRVRIKKLKNVNVGTTSWNVSPVNENTSEDEKPNDLDSIFEKLDKSIRIEVKDKLKKLKSNLNQAPQQNSKGKVSKKRKRDKTDLSMEPERKKAIIDEELIDESKSTKGVANETLDNLKLLLNNKLTEKTSTSQTPNINPTVIRSNPVNLETQIPDFISYDDNEEEDEIQMRAISEAFKDDDIVEDFKKEKKQEINDAMPKDVNLTLPGWGSWGGAGIKPSKRKNKRFIMKFAKKVKRRDDNQGNLIINEKANQKLKSHLVSEVPFPFTTVDDYEASIRAPIGDTFVPQAAYKKFIQPAIATKLGTIIEPMTDDVLLAKNRKN